MGRAMILNAKRWMIFSALLWLLVGGLLFFKGLKFVEQITHKGLQEGFFKSFFFSYGMTQEKEALAILSAALLIGFVKGRFMLSKSVKRMKNHLLSCAAQISFKEAYPKGYYFLLGGMFLLGLLMKFMPLPIEWRAFIDVAVGSALIQGAILYVKEALLIKK